MLTAENWQSFLRYRISQNCLSRRPRLSPVLKHLLYLQLLLHFVWRSMKSPVFAAATPLPVF